MTPDLTPHIPAFPFQVQKIVMDFLKENKDGGKVSAVHRSMRPRRVCVAHCTLTPLTPSALPCASVQVVNERGEMRLEDLPPSRDPISHTPHPHIYR